MNKSQKEQVVADLVERLRATESLIVADYRGLTNAQLVDLRAKLRGSGARLSVVKNTLTRRAAEQAGADALLVLLEGPTAIAFIESEGDPVAVAKALATTARETQVLALRGGILEGVTMTGEQVAELATLPPVDQLRGQLVGAHEGERPPGANCGAEQVECRFHAPTATRAEEGESGGKILEHIELREHRPHGASSSVSRRGSCGGRGRRSAAWP